MGIFDKFNNQSLSDQDAFEELCCQLFETWGTTTRGFDSCWDYRDIRGAGGDGGIEAYWHNHNDNQYIGIQAKWFPNTITSSQYGQIRSSIGTAVGLRPTLTTYIICIPHNLTSVHVGKGKLTVPGEEASWKSFEDKIAKDYPKVKFLLWDEHHIENLLQEPANDGRLRFWFEKSAVNPDVVKLAMSEAIQSFHDRYVPEITDDGDLAAFLDNFFGTIESRRLTIKDIDTCLDVCHNLAYVTSSFIGVGDKISDELKASTTRCHDAILTYADALSQWRLMLISEPHRLIDVESISVDYGAIEGFESDIQDLKDKYKLTAHADELIRLIEKFRELPGEYEIRRSMHTAFSAPHCLVVGEQGTGKTCGLASEAAGYLNERKHLPILLRAGDIGEQDGWRQIITNALGLTGWTEAQLWQALSASAAMYDTCEDDIAVRAKVAIFVDGLDERQPATRWTSLIRQGNAITKEYPRIRFVYSTRPHGVERSGADDLWDCWYCIDKNGDVPAWKIFDRYIEHYSIDLAGNTRYKWLLKKPMELRMFCTAYGGRRIDKEVSTCLTSLVKAEVDRLDEEYAARNVKPNGIHDRPVWTTLDVLANSFLKDDNPRDRTAIGTLLEMAGIRREDIGSMLDFLETYGILVTIRQPGPTSVSPATFSYQLGSRHLWDYFMAVILMEADGGRAVELLSKHRNAALMYAILLVEKNGILPLENEVLLSALGADGARHVTIDALASADKDTVGKFKQWVLDEMAEDRESFAEIVNGIIVRVACERDHPLGPLMFDEYMRTFPTPIERDRMWSIPKEMSSGYGLSMYYERDAVRHLPRLHKDDRWSQMPLLLAWCLTAVSNLRRRHCRNELVQWAMANPSEYVELFARFANCDDPQVREDMFAIAGEVVCQGEADTTVKKRCANIVLEALFKSPGRPGNRDAVLRHYGRMLVEHCGEMDLVGQKDIELSRPPYAVEDEMVALPIYAEAAESERMGGYETIHYDLARYVLVDKLESVFGIPRFRGNGDHESGDVLQIIERSAAAAGIDAPKFEGWAISATYQYLVDHGYETEFFVGPLDDKGYRYGGVDYKISGAFGSADHGSKSKVMTVAEKYVWCARAEICGFMADRVPVYRSARQNGNTNESYGLVHDYSDLLSYQSPLFEATVNGLAAERDGIIPVFPPEFTCEDGDRLCSEQELNDWIRAGNAEALISLIGHVPNVDLSIDGPAVPLALYASDWGVCGKQARAWIYAGAMTSDEFSKLSEFGTVAIAGYDHTSAFATGIACEATYISPVEYLSASWIREYDEDHEWAKIADVHVEASPLSGSGVDSLTDVGDYWYRFPSKLAMDLCGVARTDGARYFDAKGMATFEDIEYGEPYKKHYQALLASKDKLYGALDERDLHPVWCVTLQRDGNRLADERLRHLDARTEASWLIWIGADGKYCSCIMSDEYPVPEQTHEPSGIIAELLEKYAVRDVAGEVASVRP